MRPLTWWLLLGTVSVAVCLTARYTDVDWTPWVAAAVLVPYAFIAQVVITALAMAFGPPTLKVAAAGILVTATVAVASRLLPSSDSLAVGHTVPLLSANVYFQTTEAANAARAVTSQGAKVVVLQEVTPNFAEVLTAFAPAAGYHWKALAPSWGSTGLAVLSRAPIAAYRVMNLAGQPLLRVDLRVNDTTLRIYAVHVEAPVNAAAVARWRSQLRHLEVLLRRPVPYPVIAVGDFNATVDNKPFRDLLSADRYDAALPWLGTWPAHLPVLPPLLQLDHVLVPTPLDVGAVGTIRCPGSDHRMLRVSLVLPGS
jgi:endonuclease/exonuclease/phosphatase family metal-dependent hydrolase